MITSFQVGMLLSRRFNDFDISISFPEALATKFYYNIWTLLQVKKKRPFRTAFLHFLQ